MGDETITNPGTPRSVTTGSRGRAERRAGFGAALEVQFTPTLVFLGDRGEPVLRLNGYLPAPEFHTQSMMDYVQSGAWREEPSFQRYISARADGIRARGIDVDIWR